MNFFIKKNNRFVEYGLYFLAFLLSFQTRFIFSYGLEEQGLWEYDNISLYAIDIFLVLLLSVFCLLSFNRIRDFFIEKGKIPIFIWALAVLDLTAFLSIFVSQNKVVSLYKYVLFLCGIFLFILIVKAKFNRLKFIYSLLAGMFFQSILGIFQFFNQHASSFKIFGISAHRPEDLGTSVIESVDNFSLGTRWLRAYGGMDHPNILGSFLVIGLILTLSLFIYFSDKKRKEGSEIKFKYNLIINYLIYLFLLTALFFTFSRSAWLAFVLFNIVLLVLFFIKKNKNNFKILFKIFFFSFLLILILVIPYKNLVKTRLSGETSLEIKSTQERITSLEQSKKIIKDNFFFGTGIGNYTLVLKKYYGGKKYWPYQPVHNTFLLILSEIGLFGFFSFVAIFFYLIYKSFKYGLFLNLALLASLFVFMFFDHWLWSLHFGILFFWMILGIIYRDIISYNV